MSSEGKSEDNPSEDMVSIADSVFLSSPVVHDHGNRALIG